MTRLMIHEIEDAPEAARPLMEQVRKTLGFVPNLYATMAESPVVLQSYLTVSETLGKGLLTRVEQEVLHIVVSVENGCTYCVAAHSTLAVLKRIDPETTATVRAGGRLKDARLDAMVTLAREIVRSRGRVAESTVARFLSAGYSKAHLLEVIGHIGLKTIANLVNNLADTPLDEAFAEQAWIMEEPQAA